MSSESFLSHNSRATGSLISVHGSKFGRSVLKSPLQNDPNLMQTLSTVNSRIISAVFNVFIRPGCKLPELTQIDSIDCIRQLGKCFNIEDYEFNYASFWILDVMSKIIKDLQLENVTQYYQKIVLSWFRYVLRYIAVTNITREELFKFLEEMFKEALTHISDGQPIPYPEELTLKGNIMQEDFNQSQSSKSNVSNPSKSKRFSSQKKTRKLSSSSSRKTMSKTSSQTNQDSIVSTENKLETNLTVFYRIIEIIYFVFGDRFTYHMISRVYSSPSLVTPVEILIDFEDPKQTKPKSPSVSLPPLSQKSKGKKNKSSASNVKKGSLTKSKKKKRKISKESAGLSSIREGLNNNDLKDEFDVTVKSNAKTSKKKKGEKSKRSSASKVKKAFPKSKKKTGKKSIGSSVLTTIGEYVNIEVKKKLEGTIENSTKMLKNKKGKKSKISSPVDIIDDKAREPSRSKENQIKEEVTTGKKKKNNRNKGDKSKPSSKQKAEELVEFKEDDINLEIKSAKKKNFKKSSKKADIKKSRLHSLQDGKRGITQSELENRKRKTLTYEDSSSMNHSSKVKLFERVISPKTDLENEKLLTKDKFLLPLSEAVNKDFVENLIKTLTYQETKAVEDPSAKTENREKVSEKKQSKKSKSVSAKQAKKGKKKKKV